MQLHLKHPLEPESAHRHAADIVAAAADISGADLDYSPDSIDLVEDIVDGFRAAGVTGEELADSLVGFGCYVGEILTRHAGEPGAALLRRTRPCPSSWNCPVHWNATRSTGSSAVSSSEATSASAACTRRPVP